MATKQYDLSLVTTLVRSLAHSDKATAKSLQTALLAIGSDADAVTAAEAFEKAGQRYVNSGAWDARTLVVRKSNFRKVAKTVAALPEFRAIVKDQAMPLQRAYMLACDYTHKAAPEGDEGEARYKLVRFQRQLGHAIKWAEAAGLGEAARQLEMIARAVEATMAEQAGGAPDEFTAHDDGPLEVARMEAEGAAPAPVELEDAKPAKRAPRRPRKAAAEERMAA